MNETITLAVLGPDDLAILLAVEEGLFDNPIVPEQAKAFLSEPHHRIILAFDGQVCVGMASGQVMLHPDKLPAFFIAEVGVRDAYQRRGIARRLCERLKLVAKDLGCDGVWVATDHDNIAARGLYRSLEARETDEVVVYDWDDPAMDA